MGHPFRVGNGRDDRCEMYSTDTRSHLRGLRNSCFLSRFCPWSSYMSTAPFDTPSGASGSPAPATVPGAPVPVTHGLQMKRRNPLGVWLGLPLITLGIYYLVWLYKIHTELGMFDRRRIIGATGPVLAWIFGIVTLMIWPLVSTYNTGQTITAAQRSAGLVPTCSGGLGVLLVFLFGLQPLYYQMQLNKIIAVNSVPEGNEVPLYA